MTKLFFEERAVKNEVIPNLNASINSINSSINIHLVIPRNFRYGSYLNNIFGDNNKTKNNLYIIKNRMERSISNYNSTIIQNEQSLVSINTAKILPNKRLIK